MFSDIYYNIFILLKIWFKLIKEDIVCGFFNNLSNNLESILILFKFEKCVFLLINNNVMEEEDNLNLFYEEKNLVNFDFKKMVV